MKRFLQAAALSGLFLVAPMAHDNLAHAQVALSPRGSVSQTIDGTSIDIEYSRPALRGRTGLFGGQIWWGHIWTPGADWATILEVNKDITIDGVEVPAGKYSMWMVVDPGDWEVILDPEWKQFHLPEPQKNGDEITFWVTPDTTASLTETLTFDFPENSTTGTTLRLRFETHEVSMDIAVQSRLKMQVTEEEVAPYLGTYRTEVREYAWTPEPFTYDMEMSYEDGNFAISMQTSASGPGLPFGVGLLPLPQVDGIFYLSFIENGEVFQTLEHMFEFTFDEDGQVTGFQARTEEDALWMVGTRVAAAVQE
ncbi:MAG: DUF2911 domain-containing protein [Bacteroidetes bacterium]|nr:DUF2911 domain-containing protein [Bacteroidota bacterium]